MTADPHQSSRVFVVPGQLGKLSCLALSLFRATYDGKKWNSVRKRAIDFKLNTNASLRHQRLTSLKFGSACSEHFHCLYARQVSVVTESA